jgi:hypothetical protein
MQELFFTNFYVFPHLISPVVSKREIDARTFFKNFRPPGGQPRFLDRINKMDRMFLGIRKMLTLLLAGGTFS